MALMNNQFDVYHLKKYVCPQTCIFMKTIFPLALNNVWQMLRFQFDLDKLLNQNNRALRHLLFWVACLIWLVAFKQYPQNYSIYELACFLLQNILSIALPAYINNYFVLPYFNPVTPLVMDTGTLLKMELAIERGLPFIFSISLAYSSKFWDKSLIWGKSSTWMATNKEVASFSNA